MKIATELLDCSQGEHHITAELVFDGQQFLPDTVLTIKDGMVMAISKRNNVASSKLHDYGQGLISCGLVDLQVNGCGGVLFNDDISTNTLKTMLAVCGQHGTTALLPTLISCDFTDVIKACTVLKEWFAVFGDTTGILGLHLEGPFLSVEKKGIHQEEYIIQPDAEKLQAIVAYRKYFPIKMTIAVENFTIAQLEYLASNGIILAVGHSNATYEQVATAFRHGVGSATHVFNAMGGLSGRHPSVVGAILNNVCFASVIADLVHVDKNNINLLHKIKKDRLYLVSDAITAVATQLTQFEFAGKLLTVKDDKFCDATGTLAGANLMLVDAVANCVNECGIAFRDAWLMATTTPLRVMGLENRACIKLGSRPNLIHATWHGGKYK